MERIPQGNRNQPEEPLSDIGASVFATSIATFLEQFRFSFGTEAELQAGVWEAIQTAWPNPAEWKKEYALSKEDRIDFFHSEGIGLEAKIAHSLTSFTRQLHRYVQHDEIKGMVIITSKIRLTNLPPTINGKPLMTVNLIGSLL